MIRLLVLLTDVGIPWVFAGFPLANPGDISYPLRPSLRRTLTNEDPGEIHMRRVFKNRPT